MEIWRDLKGDRKRSHGNLDTKIPSMTIAEFKRLKATPDSFLNEGPCDVDVAYNLLSAGAFKAWIWLAAADPKVFRMTMGKLSETMGHFRVQKLRYFGELERQGFIVVIQSGYYKRVVLLRRPRLRKHHSFAVY